ncbi:MAG: hypothetical protein IPL01_14905 [Acidobacteria bacterium]|nr:hypothetical protein [Acidobacteriota bacterium]
MMTLVAESTPPPQINLSDDSLRDLALTANLCSIEALHQLRRLIPFTRRLWSLRTLNRTTLENRASTRYKSC